MLKQLKDRLIKVKKKKKRLAKLELKLRSMRRLATYLKETDPSKKEREEVEDQFNKLKTEAKRLDENNLISNINS